MSLDLRWRVKDSFMSYVLATGGAVELIGAATDRDGTFVFPEVGRCDDSAVSAIVKFGGGVRCRTHGGLVDAHIESPWLHIGPSGTKLSIAGTEATRPSAVVWSWPMSG
jgi:hypothetical protein